MTDRIKGLTVVLEKSYREDDCDEIINAITMLKGVVSVKKHIMKNEDFFLRERFRRELARQFYEMLEKEVDE